MSLIDEINFWSTLFFRYTQIITGLSNITNSIKLCFNLTVLFPNKFEYSISWKICEIDADDGICIIES